MELLGKKSLKQKDVLINSVLFALPLFLLAGFVAISDLWDWMQRIYSPSPYSTEQYTWNDVVKGVGWTFHLSFFALSSFIFLAIYMSVRVAREKRKISQLLSFLYLSPSLVLIFWCIWDSYKYKSSSSVEAYIAVPCIIVPLIFLNFFLFWVLRKTLKKYYLPESVASENE